MIALFLFLLWIAFWVWVYFALTQGDEWMLFANQP